MTDRWQPIATAPKTGSDLVAKYFLAYCPDEHPDDRIRVIWWEPKMNKGRGQWQDDRDAHAPRPTHWMPLPPPPEGAA